MKKKPGRGGQLGLTLEDMPKTAPHQPRDTSRMAARMVAPSLTPKRATVLAALLHDQLTTDQIEQRTHLAHQSCAPRVTELEDYGFIVDTGQRRLTRLGCPATIWRITFAGESALDTYLMRVGK